jgi:hypothetical protein
MKGSHEDILDILDEDHERKSYTKEEIVNGEQRLSSYACLCQSVTRLQCGEIHSCSVWLEDPAWAGWSARSCREINKIILKGLSHQIRFDQFWCA